MAIAVLISPLSLCSGISSVVVLVQKVNGIYFPAAYPIVGSGAVQDWIWPTLTVAFIFGIFPVYFLFLFQNNRLYIFARIIQLFFFLVEAGLYIPMKSMPFGDLLFASQPFFMLGFIFSLAIQGGITSEASSK